MGDTANRSPGGGEIEVDLRGLQVNHVPASTSSVRHLAVIAAAHYAFVTNIVAQKSAAALGQTICLGQRCPAEMMGQAWAESKEQRLGHML